MRTDNYTDTPRYCVMDGKLIPPDRPRMAVTCSKECTDARKDFRRSRQDARECRYCRRPSTPEERHRYLRWRKFEEKFPPDASELSEAERAERIYKAAHPPKKRGPKPKNPPAPPEIKEENTDAGEG